MQVRSFEAFGVPFRIEADSDELIAGFRSSFPPGSRPAQTEGEALIYRIEATREPADSGGKSYNLLHGDAKLGTALPMIDAHVVLERHLQLRVARLAPRHIFVHAGVVGWADRALVIPGRSFSGKTTLVRELIGRGAMYLSDEYAAFDPSGVVHPYPRSLHLRNPGRREGHRHAPEALGASVGPNPLRVGIILATRYVKGAIWRPRHLTDGEGLLALLDHAVPARFRPEETLRTLRRVVSTPGIAVLEGFRPDAQEVAEKVLHLMESSEFDDPGERRLPKADHL